MDLMTKIASDLNRVVKSNLFWYGVSISLSSYLSIAPLFQPSFWNAKRQLYGFGALAITLPLSYLTGRKVQDFVTEVSITNQMRHQYEIDDIVHAVNYKRAVNSKEIRLINGAHSMGELQEMMVEQMRIMSETMKALRGGYIGQPQLPGAEDELLPTEDLAKTLGTATNSGTLLIAPSGCGKTTLVRQAIAMANDHYNNDVDFQVVDCKGDEDGWLGLEQSPNDFILLDDDRAKEGFNHLQLIKGRLSSANPQFPTIAIIDEWNNGVASLVNSPEISREEKQQAVSAVRQIVTKGRSKRLYGWLTTHSPKTDAIGMDASTRQSLNVVILARGNKLGLIAAILKGGKFDFVDDEEIREALLAQFQSYVKSPQFNPKTPVALTNLAREWRLVRLPEYTLPKSIDRGVLNGGLESLFQQEVDLNKIDPSELTDEQVNELIDRNRSNPKTPLSVPAQLILDKYIQKEMNEKFIGAKWVQNFVFRSKELSRISPDQIRGFFYELAALGFGEIAGSGNSLAWGIASTDG